MRSNVYSSYGTNGAGGAKQSDARLALEYLGSLTRLEVLSVASACKEEMRTLLTGACAKSLRYLEVDFYSCPGVSRFDKVQDCWQQLCGLPATPQIQATLVFGRFGTSCIWTKSTGEAAATRGGWIQKMRSPGDEPARQLEALQASFFADVAASMSVSAAALNSKGADDRGRAQGRCRTDFADINAADLRRVLLTSSVRVTPCFLREEEGV